MFAFGAFVASGCAIPEPAHAFPFDFFGLFGSDKDGPPPVTPNAVVYDVVFEGVPDKGLEQSLRDASTLYRLREEPPPDGTGVLRRAEADLPRLTDALWGAGYYDGLVTITVASVPVAGESRDNAAIRRAEALRGRAIVPVRIVVQPGQLFTISDVLVLSAETGAVFPPDVLPARVTRLKAGDPASSASVLAAEARIVDHFRSRGYPFAKIARRDPVVDHRSKTMHVSFFVDPGPVAGLGPVTVRGTQDVDPAVVRSFIYTEPGDPYSPKALADIRKSVSRIEALASVRVREAEALDAYGNLPLTVDVTERPPRLFGFGVQYSTIDGPGARVYWAHRNLFGGAERLRLDATVSATDSARSGAPTHKEFDWSDIGGRFSASFLKPALWGSRNDLLIDGYVYREVTEGYTARAVGGTAAIRHRFTDRFSIQGGIEAERGQASDVLGRIDYTLIGLPVGLTYDSTDSLLDPTEGFRVTASLAPYPSFFGSDPGIFIARGQASTYYALDEERSYVLAGRIGLGSITGAALDEIPANRRFYAGGGGSVRGYVYQSLGPRGPFDEPIGGRSLLEGSIEARIKVTDVIGIVPFMDAGTAFESSFPDFDETIRVSAGIGLRYYTGIGPIRVDVAFPLNRQHGDSTAALYISLGQAF
nr:autotransporter assembly complex family protein [Microvirga massiliensis]